MKKALLLLTFLFIINAISVYAVQLFKKDARQQQAQYVQKVLKEEEKEKYERRVINRNPSGRMTTSEYENISSYKDKTNEVYKKPTTINDSDKKYVPQPTYKIVRYNDPPGSPELNLTKDFYRLRQYVGQGIASPDYQMIAYPVVYYYPDSVSTASDIFIIPLISSCSPMNKLLNANLANRKTNPIISTERSIDNEFAFRSLTPIDFSADGTKLLVKEKLGSSQDGIWKTNAIVYDFEKKCSYNLVELRDAIVYYWKENKKLNLDELRWDIIPLGFLKDSPYRIAAYAYAYTGQQPVFLGTWSVDVHGEQARLISFKANDVQMSVNGYKLVQDGVVKPIIVKSEQKALKYSEKLDKKAIKKADKEIVKQYTKEYKDKIKEMDYEFKEANKDFTLLQKVPGSTTMNDIPEEYKDLKIKSLQKDIKNEEKIINREQKILEKLNKHNSNDAENKQK